MTTIASDEKQACAERCGAPSAGQLIRVGRCRSRLRVQSLHEGSGCEHCHGWIGELEEIAVAGDDRFGAGVQSEGDQVVVGRVTTDRRVRLRRVDAQREQMAALPEGFSLSGPIDTAMGFAMYPELLGKDATTPVYDCSAVQWQSSGYSLNFGADDDDADFGSGSNLSDADDYCSGGLLFVKG